MTFEKKKIAAGFGWVALSKYVNRALSFITMLILAKLLSPEEFGLVAIAGMIIEVLYLFKDMGLTQALIYRKDQIEEASDTAFYMMIMLNVSLFLLAAILAPLLSDFFENPTVMPVLIVLSSNLIWISLKAVPDTLFRKQIDFKKLIIPEIVPVLLASIVGIYMAYDGHGVWSLVVRSLIVDILGLILIWRISPYRPKLRFNKQLAREMFGYGKFIVGTTIFSVILYNIDKFYVSKFVGVAALGMYALAMKIANMPVSEFGHLVCRVMFPVLSKINNDDKKFANAFRRMFKFTGLITIPMAFAIATFGPALIDYAYGEKWSGMKVPLQILAIYALFRSFSTVTHEMYKAKGVPQIMQKSIIGRFLVITLLGIPTVNYYGLEGLCYLIVVTYFVALIWEMYRSYRLTGVTVIHQFQSIIAPLVIATVSIPFIYFLLLEIGFIKLNLILSGITLSIICYLLLTYLFDKTVVKEIKSVFRKG